MTYADQRVLLEEMTKNVLIQECQDMMIEYDDDKIEKLYAKREAGFGPAVEIEHRMFQALVALRELGFNLVKKEEGK